MRVDDYQNDALASDQSKGEDSARYLLLGVFGEAGGLLTAVKKRERDAETTSKYLEQVTEGGGRSNLVFGHGREPQWRFLEHIGRAAHKADS